MADLFPPGYDPSQLESAAATAATKSSANNVLLSSGTHGLSALLAAINAAKTEATAAKNYADLLDNGTYGLVALRGLVDELEAYVKHATYGLPAIENLVDGVEAKTDLLTNGTYGLNALLTAINAAKTEATAAKNYADLLDNGTYGLVALRGLVDEVESMLKSSTYGLSVLEKYVDNIPALTSVLSTVNTNTAATKAAVDTEVAAIKAQTDKLANSTHGLSALRAAVTGKIGFEKVWAGTAYAPALPVLLPATGLYILIGKQGFCFYLANSTSINAASAGLNSVSLTMDTGGLRPYHPGHSLAFSYRAAYKIGGY